MISKYTEALKAVLTKAGEPADGAKDSVNVEGAATNEVTPAGKGGYTLAEVLVTALVLGIVAMFTIPVLRTAIADKTYAFGIKTAMAALNDVASLNEQKMGIAFTDYDDSDGGVTWLKDNFSDMNVSEFQNSSQFPCSEMKDSSGNPMGACFTGVDGKVYAFNVTHDADSDTDKIKVLIDVNGLKSPNELTVNSDELKDIYEAEFDSELGKFVYSNEEIADKMEEQIPENRCSQCTESMCTTNEFCQRCSQCKIAGSETPEFASIEPYRQAVANAEASASDSFSAASGAKNTDLYFEALSNLLSQRQTASSNYDKAMKIVEPVKDAFEALDQESPSYAAYEEAIKAYEDKLEEMANKIGGINANLKVLKDEALEYSQSGLAYIEAARKLSPYALDYRTKYNTANAAATMASNASVAATQAKYWQEAAQLEALRVELEAKALDMKNKAADWYTKVTATTTTTTTNPTYTSRYNSFVSKINMSSTGYTKKTPSGDFVRYYNSSIEIYLEWAKVFGLTFDPSKMSMYSSSSNVDSTRAPSGTSALDAYVFSSASNLLDNLLKGTCSIGTSAIYSQVYFSEKLHGLDCIVGKSKSTSSGYVAYRIGFVTASLKTAFDTLKSTPKTTTTTKNKYTDAQMKTAYNAYTASITAYNEVYSEFEKLYETVVGPLVLQNGEKSAVAKVTSGSTDMTYKYKTAATNEKNSATVIYNKISGSSSYEDEKNGWYTPMKNTLQKAQTLYNSAASDYNSSVTTYNNTSGESRSSLGTTSSADEAVTATSAAKTETEEISVNAAIVSDEAKSLYEAAIADYNTAVSVYNTVTGSEISSLTAITPVDYEKEQQMINEAAAALSAAQLNVFGKIGGSESNYALSSLYALYIYAQAL